MAEVVVSKTNLFPSSCHHQNMSVFPKTSGSSLSFSPKTDFHGKSIRLGRPFPTRSNLQFRPINSELQLPGFRVGKARKWWEKGNQPNMKEVTSAQDLVDSLLNAGDKLVVLDFFSPGCGGCKALHPKVNYEEHKSMCYSLNVHVLPFFRFYRGAQGRVCSFSCTNATIKKFKDALAKHKPERCSLGPTKGLEEKELLALSANKDLEFTYTPKHVEHVSAKAGEEMIVTAPSRSSSESLPLPSATFKSGQISKERNTVSAGR